MRIDGPTKQLHDWLAGTATVGRVPLAKRLVTTSRSKATYRVDVRVLGVELEQLPATDTTVVELSHPKLAKPWLLLSNLRVPDEAKQLALATRIVQAYRQRWAIEDLFAWTKEALDWESVRVLDYGALRTLVMFAWLAAAFLFELGTTLAQPELLLLAQLGGRTAGQAKPGQAALARGLARLAHHLVVEQLAKNPKAAATLRTLSRDLLSP